MHALNFEMNNFVVKMAINQADAVDPEFLVSYLNRIRKLTVPAYQLPQNLKQELFKLIERKLGDPKIVKGAFRRDNKKQELVYVARHFTNELPNLTKVAYEKFVEV
jgi:hypothetical protein